MRSYFTYKRTYHWAVIVILGFMIREEMLGVTSIIRTLYLSSHRYELLLNFFHSTGWTRARLSEFWWDTVYTYAPLQRCNGKVILLGDHTTVPKEGRKIPMNRRVRETSETSSKPSVCRGHKWGFIGALMGNEHNTSSIPLTGELHQKAEVVGVTDCQRPITVRIVDMALTTVNHIRSNSYLILDRYFCVKTVFNAVYTHAGKYRVDILTPAKKSYVAYKKISPEKKSRKKYGDKIKLFDRFNELGEHTQEIIVYGKKETVLLYRERLLWKPIGRELLFVWVHSSHGKMVLMSSDLSLSADQAVELYCRRAKIESFFSVLKNVLGGFKYHFWSKHLEAQSRNPRKQKKRKLKTTDAASVAFKIEVIERFVALQVIACGLLQLLTYKFSEEIVTKGNFWMRTISSAIPSERVAKKAISFCITQALLKNEALSIIDIIKKKQLPPEKIIKNRNNSYDC